MDSCRTKEGLLKINNCIKYSIGYTLAVSLYSFFVYLFFIIIVAPLRIISGFSSFDHFRNFAFEFLSIIVVIIFIYFIIMVVYFAINNKFDDKSSIYNIFKIAMREIRIILIRR